MGFADRQYARQPTGGPTVFGSMQMWSVTTWLIVINVAVFVLDGVSGSLLTDWGFFSAVTAIYNLQVWRFITYQFLHAGFTHIFFNMLALYFFGPLIEGYLGSRRYLAFYLLCGIAGAVMYVILWQLGLLHYGARTPLVGASASIFGVLIAAARVAPDTTVMLMFPPIPIKLKVLAWIMIGIAVYTIFANGANAGGEAAHLGGAALGAFLIWRPQVLNVFAMWPPKKRKRRFFGDDWR
jgi:membrane associated rhomboid family serine protease